VKIYIRDDLYLTKNIYSKHKNFNVLSLGIVSYFPLNEEGPRQDESPIVLWEEALSSIGLDAVIDECFPKEKSEFLVYGSAYVSADKKNTSFTNVKVRVGPISKELAVSGDREFLDFGIITNPLSFNSIPVLWTKAFGGDGFSSNNSGKGIGPIYSQKLNREWHPLPNVEYFDHPMLSKSDTPVPASFAAIPIQDQRRMSLLGKVDKNWLSTQWPSLPLDTHPDFFQTAPKDQWFDTNLIGGEPIYILNMNERFPHINTHIPKNRYRIFVEKSTSHGDNIIELQSWIETLVLLPSTLTGILLHRCVLNLERFDASDVASITIAEESPGSDQKPYEYYRARFSDPELNDY
jgi:Uncharacterized protein conserved in bacteria (DUF2169)